MLLGGTPADNGGMRGMKRALTTTTLYSDGRPEPRVSGMAGCQLPFSVAYSVAQAQQPQSLERQPTRVVPAETVLYLIAGVCHVLLIL